MTTRKLGRTALIAVLALSIIMSITGGTIAWFTDEVTSGNNVITSGALDMKVSAYDGSQWTEVKDGSAPLFDYKLWEPGYTTYKLLKIENVGNLAFKYQLSIAADDTVEGEYKLADVIDVYTSTVVPSRDNLGTKIGTLSNNNIAAAASLAVGGAHEMYITLKMQESAGNEYQGLSVGNGFALKIVATQDTVEYDTFDNQYDNIEFVSTADAMREALAAGKNVTLTADVEIDADKTITIAAGKDVVLDLNGNTISGKSDATSGNIDMFLVKGNLTVTNGTITMSASVNQGWNAMTAAFDVTAGGVLNIRNATIKNLGGTDMGFCVHLNNWGEVTLNVDNSTLFSNYCAVRAFNSGYDMNNISITNSKLIATRAFWVHNYTAADFNNDADKAAAAAKRINSNVLIANPVTGLEANDTSNLNAAANNTLIGSVSYGFTNREVYYSTTGSAAVANDADSLKTALENSPYIALNADVTVSETMNVAAGKDVILDLNGNDLSFAVSNSGASAIVNNKGNLEITGEGTISFVAENPDLGAIPAYATNTITNTGTLTIGEGVTVTNGSDGGASYAVDNHGVFYLNGGTLKGNRCALRVAKYNQDNVVFVMNGGRVEAKTPAWIQLPGSNASIAPKISVTINGGTMQSTNTSSADNNVMYTYSYGNSHANTSVTINGGEFLGGTVSIGSGYKGDAPTMTINGGTFEYDVLQWLENDNYQVLLGSNK